MFPPDDPKIAAAAIDMCLQERDALAKGARATAEMYTVEASTRRLVRMYETLLGTSALASGGISPKASAL